MTTNYSRPLNTPTELNKPAASPLVHASKQGPAIPRRSIFDCLKRRKTRTGVSKDNFRPLHHSIRSQSESQAFQVRAENSVPATGNLQHRELAKAKAKAYKDGKKTRYAEEKARKQIMGGVAWGFDPSAGIRSSSEGSEDSGCFVSGRIVDLGDDVEYEVDCLGRRTGRRWTNSGTWGIEQGGPGKEGKFGHGSLKGKEPEFRAVRDT